MTPLHLLILLHYYSSSSDYDQIKSNDTRRSYAYELAELGLLYTPDQRHGFGVMFAITNYGILAVQAMLKRTDEYLKS